MKSLIIVGKTNSGKSTIAKELEKKGYKRIITYTTRPPRKKEINGIDYHFITQEEFNNKKEKGFFAETADYNAAFGFCSYGSSIDSYTENSVIVLNPIGLKQLKGKITNTLVVYLDVPEDVLRMRAIQRGDLSSEIERRLTVDRLDFKDISDYYDIKINAENKSPEEIVDEIMKTENLISNLF